MTGLSSAFCQVSVSVPRRHYHLDVAFTADRGQTVALLGPNGSGKSTVLQTIAGLLHPASAQITIAGRVIASGTTGLPAHRRRIALMNQDALLFPHLSVWQNVAFGPRALGASAGQAREVARRWLGTVDLADYADARPADLSGGQRQRVALARALAVEPELLLLDEPLAAADVNTASEIRYMLAHHLRQAKQTTVLVTHQVLDAAVLADQVVVLSDGAVVESGPTTAVLSQPRTAFGAAIAGLNLLRGTVIDGGRIQVPDGPMLSGIGGEQLIVGQAASAVFPPSAVALYPHPPAGSPRNHWRAKVLAVEPGPSTVRVRLDLSTAVDTALGPDPARSIVIAEVTPGAVAELSIAIGSSLYAGVKASSVTVYPH